MNVIFPVSWWAVYVCVCFPTNVRAEDADVDHEDVGSVDYGNATTAELRDRVLAEWKGKTDEIQGYFDQLPSEEFKENSEDLKFKYYYERKGVRDIPTGQVFNVTPQQYYRPLGSVHTIEVNDSFTPKYRITTSEEERMDKYGTFNSESSDEISSEEVKEKKKKKKKDSSESGDEKPKKKKGKKTWPTNMDPKEKRKKKKPKTAEDKKRKDLVEKTLNGAKNIKLNMKRINRMENYLENEKHINIFQNKLQGNLMLRKFDERKYFSSSKNINKVKKSGLYPRSNQPNNMKIEKNNYGPNKIDNSEIENRLNKLERKRKRSRQTINGFPQRPYL